MHAVATLSLLALAGSALAAPAPHRGRKIVYETKLVTVYVTPGQPHPTPHPQPSEVVVHTTIVKTQAPPAYTPVPAPAPSSAAPVAPSSAPVVSSAAPAPSASANSGYMAVVDEWRAKLGLSALQHNSTLEANAQRTADEGNGVMSHQLFSGSMAQVLAPGDCDISNFPHIFVGGWLCERPDMAGLDGICSTSIAEGWAYNGQTGHADILTSADYSQIGCGCVDSIWGCDLH